ncbi:hypothetical protein C8R44DRAFT_703175 [Mycena epipterygia]|nr:hypothetical protein C8R44DRAFT_703175 [Mycena epipterygia]
MNSNGGGAYPPFAHQGPGQPPHQGINPAMLASYNQQQQPSQYGGVSPAQLMNSMGGSNHMQQQQQQHQQQMMMMNGAGLNPSALSAAANSGGGAMNSFMNGASDMSVQMNPQMQQPQMQIPPQALQILANMGVSRERLASMSPPERQAALRNVMAAMRQQQMQNQQAQQQQHFTSDHGGSYERPGSAMGMSMGNGSPMGMGMGSEYQQPQNVHQAQQQNGFQPGKPHGPPQFGPGFGGVSVTQGMPQQQQNAAPGSFPAPGSPYNRPTQRLPPSEPQTQALRSNTMGPPPVLRSSSASGSEANGYGHPSSSNGGTPQPQRQPSFGPQAQAPQRHPSIPRSASPVKPAPSTPTRTEAVATATPSVAPPAPAVPAPSAAPPPATIASLPPLPASVNLNPSITRVTVVPLASSLTTIPAVSADEIKAVKEWMSADVAYEDVFRQMKARMGAEYRELMGPSNVPWWEKGTLDGNASRFLHGREKFEVRYPYRKREREGGRRKGSRREGLKLPRKLDPDDANRPEELVPIRLEFDVEHHKIRDTFVWDMNACVVSPENFAQTVVEDYNLAPTYHGVITKAIQDQLSDYRAHSAKYDGDSWDVTVTDDTLLTGTLEGESAAWWCNWRKRLRSEYRSVRTERGKGRKRRKVVKDEPENERPMTVQELIVDNKTLHDDMRILIRLDIIVGSMKLDDQFEWDLDNVEASPEDFAEIYAQELGLGGEFRTAIAHSIREQVHAYQKSLYLVGHPMDGTPVQDEDLRNSFLPSLASGARAMDQVQAFTPLLNYLSDGELERNEKERDKDYNKRRKRNRGGRRGVALPDREPIRTYRTPAIGFPEPDPATLAAAAAAAAPMSRRAAAAAASLTIANLVASENGGPTYTPATLPAVPAPPPLVFKEKTTKGFFKAPPYDNTAVLRPRARIPAPIPSTAADVSEFPAPLENDPPPPPATPIVVPDNRAPRAITAKRAKELEREAKEKEFAEGQQQNMINGVWHCSNCGCPESIAIGRRKGPLGDKSQCGTCGKYWHRYRKPRPVEYNSDYEYHATGLKKDADLAKRRRGRPQSGTVPATPADTSAPQTPRDNGEGPSRQSPVRDVSPVSTASSASEPPLAQKLKIKAPSTPPPPPPATAPVAVPAPSSSPVVVPASIPRPASPPYTPLAPVEPPLTEAAAARKQSSAPVSAPRPAADGSTAPSKPIQPPQWLLNAMQSMQADYPQDKFEVICKSGAANSPEWRLKCLDCPGKVYITGPGESLTNYELHLKNRLHRQRVNDRIGNTSVS